MTPLVTTRCIGLDLIRVFAVFFVIAGHFFINTDFGKDSFGGWEMILLAAGRRLFSVSVPLFLIITGYLNINKKLSRKYYYGGIRVIVSYALISLITILFLIYYKHEDLTVGQWILKITDFSAISYGWYIEMWIGLFLLIPFLNVMWHSLETQRNRIVLIGTLLLLSALPSFVNRPSIQLLPDFWTFMYPVLFFYIGAYIRQYQPVIKSLLILMALVFLCMANPLINIFLNKGGGISPGNPFAIIGVLISALFFIGFYRIQIYNKAIRSIIEKVAICSLDMYLVSYMFDIICYKKFQCYIVNGDYLSGFAAIVSCVFLCSFAFAWFKDFIFKKFRSFIGH